MEDNLNVPIVDATQVFNPKEFEGKKVKIAKVWRDRIDSHYVDGEWNANKTQKAPVVFVETEPVSKITLGDGTEKEVVVKHRFYLQSRVNSVTKEKEVVISKSPTAKLWKFMRKIGANELNEIQDKMVTLTIEPSKEPDDDRLFLRIVV